MNSIWRLIALGLLMATYAIVPPKANALDFSLHPNTSDKLVAVLAEGDVVPGDTDRLKAFLALQPSRNRTAIYLASAGGSLYEGMRLGRYFSRHAVRTVVEGGRNCASACALAFLGGRDTNGQPWRSSSDNSQLGFHAFSSLGQMAADENEIQRVVADVLSYGRDVDAPLEILIVNFSTPSHSIYWLSSTEICALGIKLWSNASNRFVC